MENLGAATPTKTFPFSFSVLLRGKLSSFLPIETPLLVRLQVGTLPFTRNPDPTDTFWLLFPNPFPFLGALPPIKSPSPSWRRSLLFPLPVYSEVRDFLSLSSVSEQTSYSALSPHCVVIDRNCFSYRERQSFPPRTFLNLITIPPHPRQELLKKLHIFSFVTLSALFAFFSPTKESPPVSWAASFPCGDAPPVSSVF